MKRLLIAAAAVSALALSACETATPYQPLTRGSATSGGFSERSIEANRWQVSFAGNSLTDRKTVETYLLYRAAELTLAQGYDWFEIAHRNTDAKSRLIADDFGYGGYWGPSWRVYHRGRFGGWSGWGGWGGGGGGAGAAMAARGARLTTSRSPSTRPMPRSSWAGGPSRPTIRAPSTPAPSRPVSAPASCARPEPENGRRAVLPNAGRLPTS